MKYVRNINNRMLLNIHERAMTDSGEEKNLGRLPEKIVKKDLLASSWPLTLLLWADIQISY
jgi:hypothetical protein